VISPKIDASLLTCKAKPKKLVAPFTQRDVAVYLLRLEATTDDCKKDLAAVKKALQAYIVQIDAFNKKREAEAKAKAKSAS